MKYDVIVIGSGLGGLASAVLLAKNGYKVCVLEMNNQVGGTLQAYSREKTIFDSGVHYVGGLDKGQNLYQVFKYLGIMDKLKIRKLDEDAYDVVMFDDDPKVYKYGQGYDRFIRNLVSDFPEEEEVIREYCEFIKRVCKGFPLYNLRSGNYMEEGNIGGIDTRTYLESITANKKLQNVLAGTNLLYAGQPDKTPFYVHALIVNSYIESSYRFVDGGAQIARTLHQQLSACNSVVLRHKKVVRLVEQEGTIKIAETEDGSSYEATYFISNVHPVKTMEMVDSDMIKKAYRTRLQGLENSISTFYVNIVLKKNTFPYQNRNYYFFEDYDVWSAMNYTKDSWPRNYGLFFTLSSKTKEYADGLTIMTYMRYDEVAQWGNTYHTVLNDVSRGEGYEDFKKRKEEKLLNLVEKRFPGLKDCIQSIHSGTPLSLRDYLGTDDGTLYGVVKDYHDPLKTFISPNTKIPNLFLTGQNLNLHGILGVSMSAVVTCSRILGMEYLVEKIKNA